MANELKHVSVGTELTQSEYESTSSHILDSQAAGDIIYASSTSQLSRLGIGTAGKILQVNSGASAPEWTATVTGVTSVLNTSLVIGRDSDNDIDFATDNTILFRASGADQIKLVDGALAPVTNNDVDLGTSSLEFKDAFFDGTVTTDGLSVSGTPSFADGSIAIADLDIDGGTDIGADIVDADLFIIDDGAGGTNRKTAASRIKSYVGGGTHVQTGTAFNTSNAGTSVSLSNCFSSTYDFYVIHFYFHFANNTSALRFRVLDSGGERSESQYQYSSRMFESNGSGGSHSGESADYIEIINSGSAGYDDEGVHGILHVHLNNGHGTTSHSNTLSMAGFYKSSPDNSVNRVRAYYHASNYIDTIANHEATGFKFYATSGNLEFCNVKVYGLDGSSS